jgi:HD-like signal output (HDOD) protein
VIENFRQKVEETISFLPPLPTVVAELMAVLSGDDYNPNTVGKIVSKDPSMAMNVLKIANSAFFGLPQQVTTVEHAVRMLGSREITYLCLSCGASRSLRPPKGVETVDLQRFWRHSVATGTIAKILAQKFVLGRWDNLYLAGLIHDVGAVVLDRFRHDVYAEVLDLTQKENVSALEAEERIMGASHDVVGGWLMEKWQLSNAFVEAASCHHHIDMASEENRTLVAVVALANALARLTMHGFDGNMSGEFVQDSEAFRVLAEINPALNELDIVKLVWDLDSTNKEIEEIESMING